MEEITTIKDIQKLRKAFRISYSKFSRDFNELGERFRQVSIDADLMLEAAEKIMETKDGR